MPLSRAALEPDPSLTIGGDEWSLNLLCDWLLMGPGVEIDRYNDEHVIYDEENTLENKDVQFLLGHEIIGITATEDMINPTFHLTGGINLIVHAETDIDPWVLSVPGITLVGWVGRDEHGVPLPKPQAGRGID